MRKIFYSILLLGVGCVSDSQQSNQLKANVDSVSNIANVTVQRVSPVELTRVLIDSSNNFKDSDSLPTFFYNYMLDYENPWLTDHKDFSIRKSIFDSISNISLLKALLKSPDIRLRKIVDSSEVPNLQLLHSLPFKDESNYEMAKVRLRELEKIRK